jgi:hypothetical protein
MVESIIVLVAENDIKRKGSPLFNEVPTFAIE